MIKDKQQPTNNRFIQETQAMLITLKEENNYKTGEMKVNKMQRMRSTP